MIFARIEKAITICKGSSLTFFCKKKLTTAITSAEMLITVEIAAKTIYPPWPPQSATNIATRTNNNEMEDKRIGIFFKVNSG